MLPLSGEADGELERTAAHGNELVDVLHVAGSHFLQHDRDAGNAHAVAGAVQDPAADLDAAASRERSGQSSKNNHDMFHVNEIPDE